LEIVPIKIEGVTYFGHVLQPIRWFTVAVTVFKSKIVQDDMIQRVNPPMAGSRACFPTLVY